jgi:glucokinase
MAGREAPAADDEVVAIDIGGTHARFALARLAGGRVAALEDVVVLQTVGHDGLPAAWRAFAAQLGRPLPCRAALAVACPVDTGVLKLTNNPWTIHPGTLRDELGLEQCLLLNDFGAVGHAVAQLDATHLPPAAGPEGPLPEAGVVSIVGAGTGLGVAMVLRRPGGGYEVVATEGGHVGFTPTDDFEDRLLHRLRARHGRVSAERVVSGPGLLAIYEVLAEAEGRPVTDSGDRAIWEKALAGQDALAVAALDRFCQCLGTVAGDLALAHGANAVVVAGGLAPRILPRLPQSGFAARFAAKGRFEARMRGIPVRVLTHPQPGLFGAAAALAAAG